MTDNLPIPAVARQALVDARKNTVGYEMFNRAVAAEMNSSATDRAMINALLSNVFLIPDGSSPTGLIFLNLTHESLKDDILTLLSPDSVVFELGGVSGDDPILIEQVRQNIQSLKRRRFRFSCESSVVKPAYSRWLDMTSFVKLSASQLTPSEFESSARFIQRQTGAQLISQQIETQTQFDQSIQLGAKYFQGYFFSKPSELAPGEGQSSSDKTVLLQLIKMLKDEVDGDDIEEFLKRDPTLVVNILRTVNSAGFGAGVRQSVTTFSRAASLLGQKKLLKWAYLLLANSAVQRDPTQKVSMTTAVVRGRMMETLAAKSSSADSAFLVGIFSNLDRLTGMPMDQALAGMNLDRDIVDGLLHKAGPLAPFLSAVLSCENGSLISKEDSDQTGITQEAINAAQFEAINWVQTIAM